HPAIKWTYLGISAAWVGYDLISPFGLLLSSLPRLVPGAAAGQPPTVAPFPTSPVGLAWQGFNALTVAWGVIVGGGLMRTGERRRGLVLVVGASLLLGTVLFDLVRALLER